MSWIISLIIGGIVGWLASIVMKTDAQMGWIANIVVGVTGSMLGYWIAGLLGFAAIGGILIKSKSHCERNEAIQNVREIDDIWITTALRASR